ncbi:MAG: hypothetical protein HRT88_22825 [Lentisphaeraceae bacterium]|nr:hypothetical protein [Lentisphaeraceae bacterium]
MNYVKWVGRRAWINTHFDNKEFRNFLHNPEKFFPEDSADLLKDGNSATVAVVDLDEGRFVVKRYNYSKNFHTFLRRFRKSRASRSWASAHRLMNYGLLTPEPVALVETTVGPAIKHAYFIARFTKTIDALEYFTSKEFSFDEKLKMMDRVVEMFTVFKKCLIYHGDCKATNFLVLQDRLSIIDLDSMRELKDSKKFKKYFRRDLKRWFKNWEGDKELTKAFVDKFNAARLF